MTDNDPATDDTSPGDEQLSWVAASAELRRLVDELDDPTLDIDLLAGKVERAAQLIDVCRSRIDRARSQIAGVISELGSN